MHTNSINSGTAICVCKWIDEIKDARLDTIVRDFSNEAHVHQHLVKSRNDLKNTIQEWYQKSDNVQHFILIGHGVIEGEAVGVGHGGAEGQYIEWNDLWDCLVLPKNKPPHIYLIGCYTKDAMPMWSQRLTDRLYNPPVMGVNEEIVRRDLPRVKNLLENILTDSTSIFNISFVDAEIQQHRSTFDKIGLWFPVKMPSRRTFYCEVDEMQTEVDMSFSEFLKYDNHRIGARVRKAAERRLLKKTA